MLGGLYMRELCSHVPHFWEHLMFDVKRNWILCGHDGGSAGFSFAADPGGIFIRNTMYRKFEYVPSAPKHGVVPEFIFKPGRVTWLNLFRDHTSYVMRIATGELVDTTTRPAHHEHLVFKPAIPLASYFHKMMDVGVDHHFMFGYGDHAQDLERLAELLGMPFVNLTAS